MADLKQFTLLIVEDEQVLRDTIAFDLKRKGFTVLTADNAASAMKVIQANKVHLVLSDIRMPGGDGLSLLEQIRAVDPTIPVVILMTGFSDFSEKECITKGAQQLIKKPFDRKALLDSIFQSLGIAKAA